MFDIFNGKRKEAHAGKAGEDERLACYTEMRGSRFANGVSDTGDIRTALVWSNVQVPSMRQEQIIPLK